MDSPWIQLAAIVVAPFVYHIWWKDYQAQAGGETIENALPGATPVATWVTILAVVGVLVIFAFEVAGEYALDIVEQQTEMTIVMAAYSIIIASVIEEVIFRGILYVDRSTASLIASIVAISVLFAVVHGHFWTYEPAKGASWWNFFDATLTFDFGVKAWFTTGVLFVRSLWLYAMRFIPANPRRSLIPCIVAHAIANLAVVIAKAMQGKLLLAWEA